MSIKTMSIFACFSLYGACVSSSIASATEWKLDDLMTKRLSIEKYHYVLGKYDYLLEKALIDASACEIQQSDSSVNYAERGKDVIERYYDYIKSNGLPHAFGKHFDFFAYGQADKKREGALDIYGYMMNRDFLSNVYSKLRSIKRDLTAEKGVAISVIMQYLAIASLLQESVAVINGEYKKGETAYSGLAFCVNDIMYKGGNSPYVLFVPIQHANGNGHACVKTMYPINSEQKLSYKFNNGTVDSGDDELLKRLGESLKQIIAIPTVNNPTEIVQQNAIEEEQQYKTKYKLIEKNKFKISYNGRVYDVLPYAVKNSDETIETYRCIGIDKILEINSLMETFPRYYTEDMNVEPQVGVAFDCLRRLIGIVFAHNCDSDLVMSAGFVATALSKKIFNQYAQMLSPELSNDKVRELCVEFCNDFVDTLITCTSLHDEAKLFIELFGDWCKNDVFFSAFPNIYDTLFKSSDARTIRSIVSGLSGSFKSKYREYLKDKITELRHATMSARSMTVGANDEYEKSLGTLALLKVDLFETYENILSAKFIFNCVYSRAYSAGCDRTDKQLMRKYKEKFRNAVLGTNSAWFNCLGKHYKKVMDAIENIKQSAVEDQNVRKIINNYPVMCDKISRNVDSLIDSIDAFGRRYENCKFYDEVNGYFSNIIEALTGSH